MAREWHLKRNCSLTPAQTLRVYGALCAAVLGIGIVFLMHGAWIVLAFALLEVAAIALALLHYARHAGDRERLALQDGCLLVERIEAGRLKQLRLDPGWTRIEAPDRRRALVRLVSRGTSVEVGAFVSDRVRRRLARQLRRALQVSARAAWPAPDPPPPI